MRAPLVLLVALVALCGCAAASAPRRGLHFGGISTPASDDGDGDESDEWEEWDGTPLSPFNNTGYSLSILAEGNPQRTRRDIGNVVGFYKDADSRFMDGIAWSSECTPSPPPREPPPVHAGGG